MVRMRFSWAIFAVVLITLLLTVVINQHHRFHHHIIKVTNPNIGDQWSIKIISTLWHNTSFAFLQPIREPEIDCRSEPPLLLIVIHSALDHFDQRQTYRHHVRQTKFPRWKTVFVVGETVNQTLNQNIQAECDHYGDILQARFLDTYRNLTLKHLSWLAWTVDKCPQARIVLKLDDDIFVDFYTLKSFLGTIEAGRFYCAELTETKPEREQNLKWFVTKMEYEFNDYPSYCNGWTYLTTNGPLKQLWNTFQTLNDKRLFWIDDIYVTGLLRLVSDPVVPIVDIQNIINQDVDALKEWAKEENPQRLKYLFSSTDSVETLNQSLATTHRRYYRAQTDLGRLYFGKV